MAGLELGLGARLRRGRVRRGRRRLFGRRHDVPAAGLRFGRRLPGRPARRGLRQPGRRRPRRLPAPRAGRTTPARADRGLDQPAPLRHQGQPLTDASTADAVVAATAVPADGLVRLYAQYQGSATRGYIMIQSGSSNCAEAPPCTDYVAIDRSNSQVATAKGDFVELFLHRGFQKIQMSISNVLGEGERSHAIEVGARCTPPQYPLSRHADLGRRPRPARRPRPQRLERRRRARLRRPEASVVRLPEVPRPGARPRGLREPRRRPGALYH